MVRNTKKILTFPEGIFNEILTTPWRILRNLAESEGIIEESGKFISEHYLFHSLRF